MFSVSDKLQPATSRCIGSHPRIEIDTSLEVMKYHADILVTAVAVMRATTSAFLTPTFFKIGRHPQPRNVAFHTAAKLDPLLSKSSDDDDGEDTEIDISDRDWRAFRAQLVMGGGKTASEDVSPSMPPESGASDEKRGASVYDDDLDGIGALFTDDETPMSTDKFTPLDPGQWAYDSGHVIEQGAVILGGVEQDFGFGLRQQYFHKAVILVLDHDEMFTKGIILNRPTDMLLVDENEFKWRIWFGGDVQNLNHPMPEIVCIHTMKGDDKVDDASSTVMKDIQRCTFEQAKLLVSEGRAQPSDFWCFAGYAGWGPSQLMGELNRQSWYMCATDSQTLLKELANQSAYTDPRDAGLDTWELLMTLIGRGSLAEETCGDFEDLMLKEWAREHLLSVEAGGNAGIRLQPENVATSNKGLVQGETLDELMKQVRLSVKAATVRVGSLLRASSAERSPYLLQDQEFHKSVVLIIAEDENASIGLILNQPSSKSMEMELIDKVTGKKAEIALPIRFGGQYAIRGQSALIWLHHNKKLRDENIGSPIGDSKSDGHSEIWKCSQSDATSAISDGLAKPSDFLIVSGLSIWIKGERGDYQGMEGEVRKGKYEVIPPGKVPDVFDALKQQKTLTKLNLINNLSHTKNAWAAGGDNEQKGEGDSQEIPVTDGIGEGFDEDNDLFVFKSDVEVGVLSDDALRSWVATFLLGAPTLGA